MHWVTATAAPRGTSILLSAEQVVLKRGALRVEVALRPFSFTVRRFGRRLLRAGGVWVADGIVHDHFVQFTEGVVAGEELTPSEPARRGRVVTLGADGIELALTLEGGRAARLGLSLGADDELDLECTSEGEPLRPNRTPVPG